MDALDGYAAEAARTRVYKVLAECYHQPAEAALRSIDDLAGLLQLISPQASGAAAAMLGGESLEDLLLDHARLFVGPFGLMAPPYGSVYLDGEQRCMGESTWDAARCYEEFGLGAAAGFYEALDHVAVELEFMHFLSTRQIHALVQAGDAEDLCRRQRIFIEKHLAAWVPEFTRRIEAHAQTRFYRNLAVVTRLFITSDLERLNEKTAIAA